MIGSHFFPSFLRAMVNITYDSCMFCQTPANSLTNSSIAGSIVYTDASGTVSVYENGDIAWTLAGTALVWIMIPGVGFFYSGSVFFLLLPPDLCTDRTPRLLRRKNALSMIYMSMMTVAVVSFQVSFKCPLPNFDIKYSFLQWFFWGFSLAFSETGSRFIGDLSMWYINIDLNTVLIISSSEYFGMKGVDGSPSIGSARIPSLVFSVYQLMFAAITYVHSGNNHS